MSTPRTDAAILTEPYPVREIGFEVVKAKDMAAMEHERNQEATLADSAAELLTDIMEDACNAQDEAEKWLRYFDSVRQGRIKP
jgi:hypothetical protein